jgi:hypothetical protein
MFDAELNYYRKRAAEERAAAEKASTAEAATIHKSLADRYAMLAGEPLSPAERSTRATT